MEELQNKIPFFNLIDTIYNSIIITNGKLDGPNNPKILYANKAFQRVTGYTSNEVIGKTPRILQGELTDRKVIENLVETLNKGEFFEGNTVNYKKDGTPYNVQWNISPIRNEFDEVEYFFCVQKDITQAVKYEQMLKNSVKKEKELRIQKEKTLEAQGKHIIMGQMVDSIAHQWLQPLSIIKLETDFLGYKFKDTLLDYKELERFQSAVSGQVDHLTSTLEEFRSFLREDKKKSTFKASKVSNSVLLLLKDEFIRLRIELEFKLINDFEIDGFENEFKHVLINIINNAKDALCINDINEKKIVIEIDNYQIKISDNAGGIPENIINKIFQPNFTTKENINGTGIGLFMSNKIMDKISGKIDVSNIPNGTRFIITFKI
jgi:PAS domain S-box-containing protein